MKEFISTSMTPHQQGHTGLPDARCMPQRVGIPPAVRGTRHKDKGNRPGDVGGNMCVGYPVARAKTGRQLQAGRSRRAVASGAGGGYDTMTREKPGRAHNNIDDVVCPAIQHRLYRPRHITRQATRCRAAVSRARFLRFQVPDDVNAQRWLRAGDGNGPPCLFWRRPCI